MRGLTTFTVYDSANVKRASGILYAEDAAAFVSVLGDECATVRAGGRTVWREGVDGVAAESFDAAAEKMHGRLTPAQRAGIGDTGEFVP